MVAHPIDDDFSGNTNPTDVSINTVNSEEQMVGSHITEFHTPEDKEITPEDILSQENELFDNEHDQQLSFYRQRMASNHETDHEHQNTSDSTYNPSTDDELVTHKDESIPSVAMQDQDHANIMQELKILVGSNGNTVREFINDMVVEANTPTSQSKPPMFETTLHRILKIVTNKTVRDKMLELIQSSKKIPKNNVDVLDLINTLDLYRMINEGINKHYQRDKAQKVANAMVNDTNVFTIIHSNYKATYAGQEEINDLMIRVNNLNEEVIHYFQNTQSTHNEKVNMFLLHLRI